MSKRNVTVYFAMLIFLTALLLSGCHTVSDNIDLPDPSIPADNQSDGIAVDDILPTAVPSPLPGEQTSTETTACPSADFMYVKLRQYGAKLNIRDNPSLSGNIIGNLDHGSRVEVIATEEGWTEVEVNGIAGCVSSEFLTEDEPADLMPPASISAAGVYINVYKENRRLELWNGDELVGEYSIGLGFNPVGHKQREGDGRTPEGSYYICLRNPNSRFYLSLGVSYPGIQDAERGLESGLISRNEYNNIVNAIESGGVPPWDTELGGQIMVHGSGGDYDWTAGCIAVDNDVMDILWEYCTVGTKINIYP